MNRHCTDINQDPTNGVEGVIPEGQWCDCHQHDGEHDRERRTRSTSTTGGMTSITARSAAVTSARVPEATVSGMDNSAKRRGSRKGDLVQHIIAESTTTGVLVKRLIPFFFVRHGRDNQSGQEEANTMLIWKFGGRLRKRCVRSSGAPTQGQGEGEGFDGGSNGP